MQRADDKQQRIQKINDYVHFSLDIHKAPFEIKSQVKKYMQTFEMVTQVQQSYLQFLDYLNPYLKYVVINRLFFQILKNNWLFEKAEENEVTFIARYMRAQISITDDVLLIQGDAAINMFIITDGSVSVFLKES